MYLLLFMSIFGLFSYPISTAASFLPSSSSSLHSKKIARSHSLQDSYSFESTHGWHSINIIHPNTKQSANNYTTDIEQRDTTSDTLSVGGTVSHLVDTVWDDLKGLGSSEDVTITWYTGHDLLNPSCWSNTDWAPTDKSFACAVTLRGWTTRPSCFKFIELCNTPKRCIFVRVVDSCAGCAAGSKHVDLTKAAFSQLADLNEGVLTVQMRMATEPKDWYEDLWGPQESPKI